MKVFKYTKDRDNGWRDMFYPANDSDEHAVDGEEFVRLTEAQSELAALREELATANASTERYAVDAVRLTNCLTAAEQRNAEWRELLRLMTIEYACCLEAGYDRITSLRGDCDSVAKMLADNVNYAKAVAALAKPTESGASDEQ